MGAVAGVILAGGRSSRMGSAKAALEWHGSTLLRHVTGVVGRAVDGPLVVVRAPDQDLPELPARAEVHEDPVEGRGPLQGLAVGLAAAAGGAEVAFVGSTDMPFLHEAFVAAVLRHFETASAHGGPDVVLPVVHGHRQPLAAGYRTALAPRVTELVEAGQLKPAHLFAQCHVLTLDEPALLSDSRLAACDPGLQSVENVNEPEDYAAARSRPAPRVAVTLHSSLGRAGDARYRDVRAANLGEAARAMGLTVDGVDDALWVRLNGHLVDPDPALPLLAGDDLVLAGSDAGR